MSPPLAGTPCSASSSLLQKHLPQFPALAEGPSAVGAPSGCRREIAAAASAAEAFASQIQSGGLRTSADVLLA